MSDVYEVETPDTTAIIRKDSICIKGSPEVCHLITKEQRDFLIDGAMWRGWKVKKVD
ncbi:unnamed protein product [marine sediment metagenome]|uniref:Uncharacterized protein n=1 Tax=marine sediment metagenome TaxID=412755 RepID=X1CR88_9ZZZZ